MALYARHLAWLNATPEKAKKPRRESLQEGGDDSPFLAMPELTEMPHLISLWHEAGTVLSGMNGITSLTWEEINNWTDAMNLDLSLWEKLTIKRLSQEYCNEYHQASDKNRNPPYSVTDEQVDRVAVGNRIRNVLSSFKRDTSSPKYEVDDGN